MLAQILQIRRLMQQLIHLIGDIKLLVRSEVRPRQFLFHAGENLQSSRILLLFRFVLWIETHSRRTRTVRFAYVAVLFAHETLTPFGSEGWFRGGVPVAETPGEEGVVDELEK